MSQSGILLDISDLGPAKGAPRERGEFSNTFENAAVGIAHVYAVGRFLLVNDKLSDIVGSTREELLEKGFQDITHPEDMAASLDQYRFLMRGELPNFSLQKQYIFKNGPVVWGNASLSIQNRSAGVPAYGIAILQDVSPSSGSRGIAAGQRTLGTGGRRAGASPSGKWT